MTDDKRAAARMALAKATGQISAISGMTDKERSEHPRVAFAKNYNDLLVFIQREFPVAAAHLPPEAQPVQGNPAFSQLTYTDFWVYYAQIADILKGVLEL